MTVHGKDVPTDLSELINPAHTAVLVIDMQNDFCSPGGAADRGGTSLSMYPVVIPRIAAVISAARARGVRVLFARMITLPGGESDSPAWIRLRMRAGQSEPAASAGWTFAVAGTWGAEFVADLLPERRDPVVTKYRSSAFHGTDLEVILRSNGVRTVVVTGCTTEGCVESTVRDAGMHDYFTVLASDCVGSDDPVLHEASMLVMTAYRTDVATSDQILREWTPLQVGSEPQACGAAPLPRGDHN